MEDKICAVEIEDRIDTGLRQMRRRWLGHMDNDVEIEDRIDTGLRLFSLFFY